MLSDDQVRALRAPFPAEALSADTSRGFELTSIKAAYVIERLNDVFGTCGVGWRYVHAPFEVLVTGDERTEILTEVALQFRVSDDEQRGTGPVDWHEGWRVRTDGPWHWSEPILATGGHGLGRGGAPFTDARKSAVTDGLTKAASVLGIGHQVFKGLVRAGEAGSRDEGNGRSGGNGKRGDEYVDATAFWSLYNGKAKPLGVPIETAKDLAGRGDWAAACRALADMITQVTP